MGRKKILKLQRKSEKEQEIVSKKVKKKMMIGIVFLAVLLFAGYQVNIALKNSKNVESNIVSSVDSDDNNTDSESLQEGSTQSMEPTESINDTDSQKDSTQEYRANRVAIIATDKGDIKLELYTNDTPKTVENFVKLANEKFYDGITFHRVIPEFMIQGGDPLSKDDDPSNDGTGGPGYKFEDEMNPIALGLDENTIKLYESQGYEYDYNLNSYKVNVGSLAMANSGPNTNGSQFFIVTEKDQHHLNGKHTVFGRVLEGMDVVRSIEQGDVMERVYIE